jgi:hypothetical protein
MDYELEKWDRFISNTLNQTKNVQLDQQNILALSAQSASSRDSVRQQMMQQVFSLTKEKATELFVQQHQAVLIRLLDEVHKHLQDINPDPQVTDLYKTISEHLGFVLNFIENYFSKYFNLDERVPATYLQVAAKEICDQVPACRKALEDKGVTDEKLMELIFSVFGDFCTARTNPYTYRDLIYRKDLIKELEALGSMHKEGCIYAATSELLIYMNFNSTAFFNYFLSAIHNELKKLRTADAKIEKLAWHQKEIAQIHIKPGYALFSGDTSIKDLLVTAIEQEIQYLQAINNANIAELNAHVVPRDLLLLPFKGSEIYLLHKAFLDAGGAPGEVYKTLLERTAPFLANKTTKGFSSESLCKYSDKVTPEVKDDVKRFLQKMIRNIDSYD